jgi:serine/threonine-protein kinase RsbW
MLHPETQRRSLPQTDHVTGGFTWLRLPAVESSLAQFTEFVHEGVRKAALPASHLLHVELVLEELLVNVFRYAYSSGESGDVSVGYGIPTPYCLRVDVCDSGRAFNPLDNEDPDVDLPLAERPIGGLGVFLVKKIANSVSYKREDGRNIVSFDLT